MSDNNDLLLDLSKDEVPDTVQSLRWFAPNDNMQYLAEGKWSGIVNVHEITRRGAEVKYSNGFDGPVTAVEWTSEGVLCVGHSQGVIVIIDLKEQKTAQVATLGAPILKLRCWKIPNSGPEMLIAGLADNRICAIHLATKEKKEWPLPKNLAAFDFLDGKIAVALEDESYFVCSVEDLANNKEPTVKSANFPNGQRTTNIALHPNLETVLLSSTGGELKEVKLITQYSSSSETVLREMGNSYMVTAIEYCKDPQTKLKVSAGADGELKVWANTNSSVPRNKRPAPSLQGFAKSEITAVSCSPNGNFIAYSTGNSWNHGIYSLRNDRYSSRSYLYNLKP